MIMKDITIVLMFLVFLSSCGDDKVKIPENPSVFINPNFGNTDPGGELVTKVEISAPAGFKSLLITTIKDGSRNETGADEILPRVQGQTDTTFSYTIDETDKSFVGSEIDIEFLLIDDLDRTDTAFYRVGINPPSFRIFPGGLLQPPITNSDGGSTSNTFFTTTNEQPSWTINQINSSTEDVKGEIDFGYYYDESNNQAIFASIADYPIANFAGIDTWEKRNQTIFKSTNLTASEFDEADYVTIYRGFENGTAGNREQRSSGLMIGDIIAFETDPSKTDGSKRGLIQVIDIKAGTDQSAFVQVNIKFEK